MVKLSRRIRSQTNKLALVACCLFFLCAPKLARGQSQLSPADFIGPAPGYVYYYETKHGQKMSMHGLTWDRDGSALVEETFFFPDEMKSGGMCVDQLSKTHGLHAEGNRLMRKGFGLSKDGWSIELDLEAPVWGNPFTGPKGEKGVSQCRTVNLGKQHLFGKQRTVLEVVGEYCVSKKYASGIGLIEYTGFQLIRIEKKEVSHGFDRPQK